jgi:hypothetical protein
VHEVTDAADVHQHLVRTFVSKRAAKLRNHLDHHLARDYGGALAGCQRGGSIFATRDFKFEISDLRFGTAPVHFPAHFTTVQRSALSFRTASSIKASSSCRVIEIRSDSFTVLSLVTGQLGVTGAAVVVP